MKKKNRYCCLLTAAALSICLCTGCSDKNQEKKETYRQLGIEYMKEGNYAEAVSAFNSALKQSVGKVGETELDICYYKAAAQYAGGDIEAAIATYTALIEYDKEAAEAYFQRGCLYLKQGNTQQAKNDYDKAIQYNPEEYELYISIYENLAAYGQQDIGESYLDKAFSVKSGEAEGQVQRGRIYFLKGEYENAVAELTKAIEAEAVDAYFYLAQVYDAQGDSANAENYYQAYAATGNANAKSLNALGEISMEKGNYAEALGYFSEALAMEGNVSEKEIMQNQIIAYEYSGDFSSAWKVLLEYIKLYPMDEQLEREYIFLEHRQQVTEPQTEEVQSTEKTDSTEAADSTEAS